MKKIEYFISYYFIKPDRSMGFGSSTLLSNKDLDSVPLSDLTGLVKSELGRLGSEAKTVVPLFYHKRRVIEE